MIGPMTRRTGHSGADFWPAVADSFLGILGVVVFVTIGIPRPDPVAEKLRTDLTKQLADEQARGVVLDYIVSRSKVTIVYPEKALSFEQCEWDLQPDKAERIRTHMRANLFNEMDSQGLIENVEITGHADSERAAPCNEKLKRMGKPLLTFSDNLELSQNRARAVYNALLGVNDSRNLEAALAEQGVGDPALNYLVRATERGSVLVAGYGDTKPYEKFRDVRNHPLHRRVEISVQFAK